MAHQIELGGQPELSLLGWGHRFTGRAVPSVFAQLDLHKGQVYSIFRNNIKLPQAAAEISRRNPPALPTQPVRHLLFPPLAQLEGPRSPAAHRFFRKVRRWMAQGPNSRSSA